MPNFNYKAIGANGKTVQGSVTADRKELASRQLRAQGLTLLDLQPGKAVAVAAGGGKAAGKDQVLSLTRELTVLLRAGLPIDRALKVMIDMAAEPKLAALLDELLTGVKGGKGLSQSLQPHQKVFGNFYINMVRSGEASGHLAQVLGRLLEYLERSKEVRSSVISALIYPSILLTVAVLSIAVILGFVVPQFEALFADMGDSLPVLTRMVIAAGDAIADWGWLMLLIIAGIGWFLKNWLATPEGQAKRDSWLLKLPILGDVVFKYEIAKFARTVGTLVGNGVSLLQAITIGTGTVDNTVIRDALSVLEPAVKRGQRMSHALDEASFVSPLVIQMVRVGEESGSIDQMLIELAEVYDGEVEAGVKRALAMLEPALILFMGGAIAVIIIAILSGILSVNDMAF